MSVPRSETGSVSITVALALPVLAASLSGAIAIGLLRTTAERVRAAADLAVVIAANDQDDRELASTGRLALAADAVRVARTAFASNLEPIAPLLAADPADVARDAQVIALPAGAADPRTGARRDAPTVHLRASVPLRAFALGAMALPAVVPIDVRAAASPR